MSDSVRPHRRQPSRLRHPWDSPGKSTGVSCYFLLQCMKVKSESEVAQSCPTHSDPMDCSLPGSSVHGIFQASVLESGAIAFSWLIHESPAIQVLRWWWMSVSRSPPLLVLFRFYARDSGLLKFEIQAGLLGRPINHTVRRLVAFTFHPFEPFAISVQRTNAEYVVNFHMRHCCT